MLIQLGSVRWSQLFMALEDSTIGESRLALKLRMEHKFITDAKEPTAKASDDQ